MNRITACWLIGTLIATLLLSRSLAFAMDVQSNDQVVTCDLAVIGGTPCGVACAVRAAREGLSVVLVNRHEHLGGMLSSGLGVWDTQYEGRRSPIYDELRHGLMDYYRTIYGDEFRRRRNVDSVA